MKHRKGSTWNPDQLAMLAKMGETMTYPQIAAQCGYTDNAMHKILKRNGIAFKSQELKNQNPLVQSRQKKGAPAKVREYFIKVRSGSGGLLYNDWYDLREILLFPECKVDRSNLYARLDNVGKKNGYETAWKAITTPVTAYSTRKVEATSGDFDEWVDLMKLWPVGMLAHTVD